MEKKIKTHKKSKFSHASCFLVIILLVLMITGVSHSLEEAKPVLGDIDGNKIIDLGDAITGLKILAKTEVSSIYKNADVNGDTRIGIQEVIYDLQFIAGLITGLTGSEQAMFEDIANVSTLALADTEENIRALEHMSEILSFVGLHKVLQNKKRSLKQDQNSEFPCGTIEMENTLSSTVVFTFTGTQDCEGVTGKVKTRPSVDDGGVSYNIIYENLKKDDCTITGTANAKISVQDDQITAEHTLDDMTVCGQKMSGTAAITLDTTGQTVSLSGTSQNNYTINDSQVTISYSYTLADGISGKAKTEMNGQTYDCEFSDIKTNTDCDIPVAGSVTVSNMKFDFTDTSCDNPVVTVTFNDSEFYLSLEHAKNMLNIVGPTPRHAGLKAADTCDTLLSDFKERTIKEMQEKLDENLRNAIEWGGCWPIYYMLEDTDGLPGGNPPSPTDKGATEYSETNTQVDGVDEADFVKNDGSHIYILADGKFQIIRAWPPEESSPVSLYEIEGRPEKMFVHNKKAFVYSSLDYIRPDDYNGYYPYYYDYRDNECTYGYNCDFTGNGRKLKITVLDISDMASPALVRETYFSGSYLNSRRIGNAVHSVLVFPEPQIQGVRYWPEELNCNDCYWCWPEESPEYTEDEMRTMFEALRQKNHDLILNSDIKDWLPSMKDVRYADGKSHTEEGLLGDCDDYYVSLQGDGKNFLSMVSASINNNEPFQTTNIVGRPGAVYASSSAFYIVSRHQHSGMFWFFDADDRIEEASTVHKFSLNNDPPSSAYKGSGVVKGRVLNQFSMDEYEGFFRVATTTGHSPSPAAHSTISVFKDNGTELAVVGQIDGIAPTEDIRSARFDGNRGYIVTFKKTDPLFVFDISDPYNPLIAGELKIPGFSTYMHRMDDTHLLTIGYDAEDMDTFAWFQGIMLQIFDVSDMKNPKLTHKEVIGTRGSTSDAATNHLAFNFFRPRDLLAIPMVICEGDGTGGSYGNLMTFSGLMVYKVTLETGFEYLGGVPHETPETGDSYRNVCSNWWTEANSKVKRSIFMDDYVFSITEDEIKANLISKLGEDIAVIRLTGK